MHSVAVQLQQIIQALEQIDGSNRALLAEDVIVPAIGSIRQRLESLAAPPLLRQSCEKMQHLARLAASDAENWKTHAARLRRCAVSFGILARVQAMGIKTDKGGP